jgi:hypothetical protein
MSIHKTPDPIAATRPNAWTLQSPPSIFRRQWRSIAAATGTLFLVTAFGPNGSLHAQGAGGSSSTTAPAASANIKRVLDKSDPLEFLLDRKKPLEITKVLEDSLKYMRKEMQRMQEVVYKDLDKAATVKEQGQPPSPTVVFNLTKESEDRVKDIQSAYRDRARGMLSPQQIQRADSLETIWKRTLPRAEPLPVRRPPTIR